MRMPTHLLRVLLLGGAVSLSLALVTHRGVADLTQQFATQQIDEKRRNICQWLSTTKPSSNHHSACKQRQPTTGEWFLRGEDFRIWKQVKGSLLWLYGTPGCGKTILSSTIIEDVKEYCKSRPSFGLAYFYFDFNEIEKQKVSVFVSSLLAQLCSLTVGVPELLVDLYKDCQSGQQKPATSELKATLSEIIKEFEEVFFVVDALDECPKTCDQEELLAVIAEIKSWSPSKLHLLVTSRLEPDIEEALYPLLTSSAIPIQGFHIDLDIRLHVADQLASDPKLKRWPGDVKMEIENALVEGAGRMFRWVFCQLGALKKCLKVSAIRKALKALPKSLDDTHARILMNLDQEYQQEAVRALFWLAFSGRPLEIRELAEAVVVNPQSSPSFDPGERFPDPCMILQILSSLVAVSCASSEYKGRDLFEPRAREKIRLAHFSVKEYLLSERIQLGIAKAFALTGTSAQHHIAESSIQYILHYAGSAFKTTSLKDLDTYPLLQYACQFWYRHVQMTTVENQKLMEPIIFKIFNPEEAAFLGWLQLHRTENPLAWHLMSLYDIGTPLYYASDIGLAAIVDLLLKQGADVQARTKTGEMALHRAAIRGHSRVIQVLLENGAPADVKTRSGQTPLHQAAVAGHGGAVELLLANGADIELEDNFGTTALQFAAYHENEEVAKLLLHAGANIEASNGNGQTALHWAAYNQQTSLLGLLVENGADLDARNRAGETAMHYAARLGHLSILRQLLKNGAEIEAETDCGETAPHWAASNGCEPTARLLLELGAQVDARDVSGKAALSRAAKNGHPGMVRLLLDSGSEANENIVTWMALHDLGA